MIKFTDSYFGSFQRENAKNPVMIRPEDMMMNASFKEKKIQLNNREKKILKNIIDNILLCNEAGDVENSLSVYYQILAIFGLVRDHTGENTDSLIESDRITRITHYIHNHIYTPKKLRTEEIARNFHLAEKYFGTFFKRNTGISYKKYISRYKLGLIENRLRQGTMNKSEIAAEFGFTDTSHLIHFLDRERRKNFATEFDVGNST